MSQQTNWGGRRGLNPRPPESQSGALPTELRPPQARDYRVAVTNALDILHSAGIAREYSGRDSFVGGLIMSA